MLSTVQRNPRTDPVSPRILVQQTLDSIIKSTPRYEKCKLQDVKNELIINIGSRPLLSICTINETEDIDHLDVIRKSRLVAQSLQTSYFAISNLTSTSLFKTSMGPLRDLQLRLWKNHSPMTIHIILDEMLTGILEEKWQNSKRDIFLPHYTRLFNGVKQEYITIFKNDSVWKHHFETPLSLGRAERLILETIGVDCDFNSSTREEIIENLATQAAYLLLNKIFCYVVIQSQFHKQYGMKLPKLFEQTIQSPLQQQLNKCFSDFIQEYEFAPIFQPDPVFTPILFTDKLTQTIKEFLDELSEFDWENITDEYIGEMYQLLLPLERKKALGQIYTPSDVARVMTRLAIRRPDVMVLDPACGCGTFLKEVYQHLVELNCLNENNGIRQIDHNQLLHQIWGVEINAFPAQLSMMTLNFMNLHHLNESVGVFIEDFLDLGPMQKYIVKTRNLHSGELITREMPHKFDVILANPPYIKQEKIPNKIQMLKRLPIYASYRSQLENNQNSLYPKSIPKIPLSLTAKTDYYGFFLWYSTFFLRENGILCYIIPNKWMDVQYGEELKEFILARYHIHAVIGFSKNIFPTAQVSTIILLLELKSHPDPNHIVRFLNINSEHAKSVLESLVWGEIPLSTLKRLENDKYLFDNPSPDIQRTLIPQSRLVPQEKWSFKYLFQSEFERILVQKSLIKLHNERISTVIGGIKTGANEFFFPDSENLRRFKIESQVCKPGIKSGRNIPLEMIINQVQETFLSIPVKIDSIDLPGIVSYVQFGEQEAHYPERPSLIWQPWYAIPPDHQDCPDILFLRHIDSEFRAHWNQVGCIVADGIRGIKLKDSKHILFYLGILNSTFFYWQAHIQGRWEGQGDLQLLVYELKDFVIPDIIQLGQKQREGVEKAMQLLLDRELSICNSLKYRSSTRKQKAEMLQLTVLERETLDRAVLRVLDMENCYDLLISETNLLETYRLSKKI